MASLIDRLKELDGKATPGPWYHQFSYGSIGINRSKNRSITPYVDHVPDAELITELRNALPKLLAVVEAAAHARYPHGLDNLDKALETLNDHT